MLPNPYPEWQGMSITQLMNGNYLVVFDSTQRTSPLDTQTNVNGLLFDPLGNQIGDILTLNEFAVDGDQGSSTVASLDDGGFLITYRNADSALPIWEEHNAALGLDAAASISNGFNAPVAPADLSNPANSHLLLSTKIELNASDDTVELYGRFLNSDANGFNAPFLLATRSVHVNSYGGGTTEQAALSGGNYAVVTRFHDRNGDDLIVFVHDSSGNVVGSTNVFLNGAGIFFNGETSLNNNFSGGTYSPQITALDDGGFVVSWIVEHPVNGSSEYYENFTHDVYAQVFNSNGTARTGQILLDENVSSDEFGITSTCVVGFADGGFGVVWVDGLLVTPDVNNDPDHLNLVKEIYIRVFDGNGIQRGGATLPYAGALTYEESVEAARLMNFNVAPLEDGRAVLTWYVDNQNEFEPYTLHSIILDPRDPLGSGNQPGNATSGNDYIVGTRVADVIFRSGGADTIHGWAGDDRIEGDFADDALYDGGLGTDIIDFGGLGSSGGLGGLIADIVINLDTSTATFRDGRNLGTMGVAGFEEVRGSGYGETIIDRNSTQSADILRGAGGSDILRLTLGNDTAYGGAGNDTIEVRRWLGTKDVFGNSGIDTLDLRFNYEVGDTRIDLGAGTATRFINNDDVTLNSIENVSGSNRKDVIIGNDGDNRLDGFNGNDVIVGGLGLDDLLGGDGDDAFQYDATDIVAGESVDGGAGSDALLAAGSGTFRFDLLSIASIETIDFFNFGIVDRVAVFTADQFRAAGVALDALVDGNAQAKVTDTLRINLTGGTSLDLSLLTFANWGEDGDLVQVFGSSGKDAVTGTSVADEIRGGAGTDVLDGADGDDRLWGDAGEDRLDGGRGRDTLSGGGGSDIYVITDSQAVPDIIIEQAGAAAGSADQIDTAISFTNVLNVEILRGTGSADIDLTGLDAQSDRLIGNSSNNILNGLAGDDDLQGANGDDTLIGGQGADSLNGGAGIDTASYASSSAGVDVDLVSGNASGGEADGDTFLDIENLVGSGRADSLTGNGESNVLSGGGRNDLLLGRGGDDTLDGGDGDDILEGGNHDDVLTGGRGTDEMTGGAGLDRFDFNSTNQSGIGSLRDIITDFSQADGDLIDLRNIDARVSLGGNQAFQFTGNGGQDGFSGAEGELRWSQSGNRTIVELDSDGDGLANSEIRLNGQIDLLEADFLL
ncbi:hypothetical protein [Aestuariivirga sp.]|uniref:calcium-binding protein n=1 Tax=Aestuariivirga sp. TaxID=2650926 RepID=UPI003593616B